MNNKVRNLILCLTLLSIFNSIVNSQNDSICRDTVFFPIPPVKNENLFIEFDIMPEFPGGEDGLISYITSNTNYPPSAIKDSISGTVIIVFVVDTNGAVNKIRFFQGLREDIENECIRMLEGMPKWKPGSTVAEARKGYYRKFIPVHYSLRLNFTLSQVRMKNAINIIPK
jgi:protein TonB